MAILARTCIWPGITDCLHMSTDTVRGAGKVLGKLVMQNHEKNPACEKATVLEPSVRRKLPQVVNFWGGGIVE
jgi:hypothetical protein